MKANTANNTQQDHTVQVFNIQRFSTHDGKGIRTNIFFQGCPLNCNWCSNPESRSFRPTIMFDERLCKGFGECANAPTKGIYLENGKPVINRNKISDPGVLKDVCPAKALVVSGEKMPIGHIVEQIEKDIPFYKQSGGGITLTGGEPFSQGKALKILVINLKKLDLHITVETSLYVKWNIISKYLDYFDVFLADLKHVDPTKFKKHTTGDIKLVLNNFRELEHVNANVMVRIPVVPGFNNTKREMHAIIDFALSLKNVEEIHLIPYHKYGIQKYKMMDKYFDFKDEPELTDKQLIEYQEYGRGNGMKTKIEG